MVGELPVSEQVPSEPLVAVSELSIEVGLGRFRHAVVDDLELTVGRGEIVALVGESGSGKSLTARAIMGLLPAGIRIAKGRIRFGADELTRLGPGEMDRIRGRRIAMLFQQPQVMLDPTCRVGDQVAEAIRKHLGMSRRDASERAIELLRDVGIPDPARTFRSYSFELSGGLAQRVMIAAALSADPDLLIADEPTTALDVTVQAQILRLLDDQRRKRRMAVLLISHDLSVVAAVATRIVVIYAGRILEEGPTSAVLKAPRHPYTRALVACSLLETNGGGTLNSIPGSVASAKALGSGCRFHPRCDVLHAAGLHDKCIDKEPDLVAVGSGVRARCWANAREPASNGD
jgi:peptide/nickel transport system ATP-binding protein